MLDGWNPGRLRQWRVEHGLSQNAAGRATGLTGSLWSRLESGHLPITDRSKQLILEGTGLPEAWFLRPVDLKSEPNRKPKGKARKAEAGAFTPTPVDAHAFDRLLTPMADEGSRLARLHRLLHEANGIATTLGLHLTVSFEEA